MQVVLTKDIPGIGRKGDLKNVKKGFFANFLAGRGAIVATQTKIQEAQEIQKRQVVEKERIAEQAHEISKKIKGAKIVLKGKAKGDKLYGSITEREILDALQEKLNIRLEKEHLLLSEHIKVVGTYEIPVRLKEGVETKFTLEIKAA